MKTKTFLSASRLAVLMLVCVFTFGFAGCGGDDDEPTGQPKEKSIDELLSNETTPIDFKFSEYLYDWDQFILFDYAGNNYVGTDTIVRGSRYTLDLRQGKHSLLWIFGLDNNDYLNQYWKNADDMFYAGVHYNPENKSFSVYDKYASPGKVKYCEKELEITPYLMAAQQIEFTNYVAGSVQIIVTDIPKGTAMPEWIEDAHGWDWVKIGKVTGIPSIKTVFLKNNDYRLQEKVSVDMFLQVDTEHRWSNQRDESARDEGLEINSLYSTTLCPLSGLDNIQLGVDVWDVNGNLLPTNSLPTFNMRRGYVTTLRGPLFSGSTSDWTVKMEPYDN